MEIYIKRKGIQHKVLIDDADWPLIKDYKWHITGRDILYIHGYKKGIPTRKQPRIKLHRLIMGLDNPLVDHENRNGLDCRRQNLRFLTKSGNNRNCVRGSSTGFRGVYPNGNGFMARIQINYKSDYLGTFSTPQEASVVYEKEYKRQIEKETL